jgi:hypothetical protein
MTKKNAHNNKDRKSTVGKEEGNGTCSRGKRPRNNKRGETLRNSKESNVRKICKQK